MKIVIVIIPVYRLFLAHFFKLSISHYNKLLTVNVTVRFLRNDMEMDTDSSSRTRDGARGGKGEISRNGADTWRISCACADR